MRKLISIIFCKFLYKVKYENIKNLEKIDQCLICPNHSSVFDPTFIYPVVDNLYIMAKKEVFKNKIIEKFLKHYNVFPVDRNRIDAKSLMYSIKIFEENKKCRLLIFPEGKVIKDEREIGKTVRKGAVFIAANKNIPIIPVHISRRPSFFSKVKVIFGEPLYINKETIKNKNELRNKSNELIRIIYEL